MDTLYSRSLSKITEIIEEDTEYLKQLAAQIDLAKRIVDQIRDNPNSRDCPFCGSMMFDLSHLKEITIDTPTWYNSPFSVDDFYGHDDLIPQSYECQACGVFDHEPIGEIAYHWTRTNHPKSSSSLAAILFKARPIIDEVILSQTGYVRSFFFKAGGIWYSFGEDTKKEEILTKLGIDEIEESRPVPQSRPGYIYLITAETGHCKIGRTKDVSNRMAFFGVKLPFKFEVVHTFPADDMCSAESVLHQLFAQRRSNGEWFDLSPEDIALIRQITRYQAGGFIRSD